MSKPENYDYNKDKLQKIRALKDGWNGYSAKAIPESVCNAAEQIFEQLQCPIRIFPTAAQTIQFEMETDKHRYFEAEVAEDGIYFFTQDENGKEEERPFFDVDCAARYIRYLYGWSHSNIINT